MVKKSGTGEAVRILERRMRKAKIRQLIAKDDKSREDAIRDEHTARKVLDIVKAWC